jgi:amino acid transporter
MDARGESPAQPYRLAKLATVFVVMASALAHEYGVTVNFAATQALSVYPLVRGLVPWAMFAAGVVLIPKVYLYMRFSRHAPRAGSVYVWIGRSLNLPLSFVLDFLNWVSLTAAMGFIAYAFGTFLGQALVSAGLRGGSVFLTPVGHIVLGAALIWTIYWAHASGIGMYGALVRIFFWIIVASALLIIGYGFGTTPDHFVQLAHAKTGLTIAPPASIEPPSLGAFLAVTALLVAAYGGLNGAPALGGEARNATRTVPLGLFFGWLSAIVLYTAVVAALFHAAPWWAVTALIQGKHAALATAPGLISLVAPPALGVLLSLVIALVVAKTAVPQMLVCSRLVFAWAEDGIFSPAFLRTSTTRAPEAALRLTALLATLFMLQSALVGWAIAIVMRAMVILIVLGVAAVGALNLHFNRRFRGVAWADGVGRGPAVVVAAVTALFVSVVLLRSAIVVPHTALGFQPGFQGLVAALLGWVIYAGARARAERRGVDLGQAALALPVE